MSDEQRPTEPAYRHADDPVLAAAYAVVRRTRKEIGDDTPSPPLIRALRRQLQETLENAQRRRSGITEMREALAQEEGWLELAREELVALTASILAADDGNPHGGTT